MPSTSRDSAKLRVAVLMGGQSREHDVSLASGRQVLSALDPRSHDAFPVIIDPDGGWHVDVQPTDVSLAAAPDGSAPSAASTQSTREATGVGTLEDLHRSGRLDVVFLALHGPGGEDGTVQGLLELSGVPYTGSGVLASALAMDKVRAKGVHRSAGIPVARDQVITRADARSAEQRARVAAAVAADVGYPCVVKPVAAGSSVATRVVEQPEQLDEAVDDALQADQRALVEELVTGTEVTCGVLGGGLWEPMEALPVTEIVPASGTFFDYRAKYTKGACDEITPARLSDALTQRVQELAVTAHDCLGCEGMSRTDFIIRDDEPLALETNTIPGMTETSLLPQAAAAHGLSFPALLDRLIRSAMIRADQGEAG